MEAPPWVKQILDTLKNEGKVPVKHTGKVVLSYDLSQGGFNSAELTLNEKLK